MTEPFDCNEFRRSIAAGRMPAGLSGPLQALWWVAKGDWDRAHALVQADEGRAAARVHAYLHRVEGDIGNAHYWYGQAGEDAEKGPPQEEWERLVSGFLSDRAKA
jgi:hypothetical protein